MTMQSFVNKGETNVSFIFRGEVPDLEFTPGEVKTFDEEKFDFYTFYLPVFQVSSFIFPVTTEEEGITQISAPGPVTEDNSATLPVESPLTSPLLPPAPPVLDIDKEIAALESKSKSELQDIALRLDLSTDGLKNEIKDRIVNRLKG